MPERKAGPRLSRRTLLIGGGAGVGLIVAWAIWPRSYRPSLRAGPGETLFNAFLKVGADGRVIVAVPQAELGQGVYTSLPQILADELGADWRTVAVEPAPISPAYANALLADAQEDALPWRRQASRGGAMITGGSTSIRAFEGPMRDAGAGARALLMKAAAARWDVDWERLDTQAGFVTGGGRRIRFAEIAEEAAELELPDRLPVRGGLAGRLTGQPLPRLDLPAKVDGSALFASDVRLPGMAYASVRQGPHGETRLLRVDRAAAERVPGVIAVVENPGWVAAVATNWWAANRAVESMRPAFETRGPLASSWSIDRALAGAAEARTIFSKGEVEAALGQGRGFRARYAAGPAPNVPMETLTATARFTGDRLEVWAPTQAPGLARAAAARAADLPEGQVTLYQTLVGSGYGRKLETGAIAQAVAIARAVERPVQLVWSRMEETLQDGFRPAVRAVMHASLADNGMILGWRAEIVAPDAAAEVAARIGARGARLPEGDPTAGAVPPYGAQAVEVLYRGAQPGIRTGIWRSGAHSTAAFFTECFIDELARRAGIESFSFRMQMLGSNPRLARCLSSAAALGGWDGGQPGSAMGIAAHSAYGSHAATVVEVEVGADQRVRVNRAVCAVDCGRIVNPDIVRQQIEGGIIHGIAGATGNPIRFARGLPTARGLGDLALPLLGSSPEVTVEIIPSEEPPGGATELGVPPVAPAIANALFALTGRRIRTLPLGVGGA